MALRNKIFSITVILSVLLSANVLAAKSKAKKKVPVIEKTQELVKGRFITDNAKLYTEDQVLELDTLLRNYAQAPYVNGADTTRIFVYTTNSLDGYTPSSFVTYLTKGWTSDVVSGSDIIFLLKPKTEDSNGEIYIGTGPMISSYFSDIKVGNVIDDHILPLLKLNDYFGATKAGIVGIENTLMPKSSFSKSLVKGFNFDYFLLLDVLAVFLFLVVLYRIYCFLEKENLKQRVKALSNKNVTEVSTDTTPTNIINDRVTTYATSGVSKAKKPVVAISYLPYKPGMPLVGKSYIVLSKNLTDVKIPVLTVNGEYYKDLNIDEIKALVSDGSDVVSVDASPKINNNSGNNRQSISDYSSDSESIRQHSIIEERERRDREERERRNREERERRDREERERRDREERERRDREERERRDREERERREREIKFRSSSGSSSSSNGGGSGRSFGKSGGGSGSSFGGGGGAGRSW